MLVRLLRTAPGEIWAGQTKRRAPDLVARLEVVEVLVARHRLDDRQRPRRLAGDAVEHRHGEVAAVDVVLEQHLAVVGEGGHQRARDVGARAGEPDAQRRALAGGLDHEREAEPRARSPAARSPAPSSRKEDSVKEWKSGVGMPAVAHQVLGEHLVGAAACRRPRPSPCRAARSPRAAPGRCRPRRRGRAGRRRRRRGPPRAARPPAAARRRSRRLVAEPLERVLDLGAPYAATPAARASAPLEHGHLHRSLRRRPGRAA